MALQLTNKAQANVSGSAIYGPFDLSSIGTCLSSRIDALVELQSGTSFVLKTAITNNTDIPVMWDDCIAKSLPVLVAGTQSGGTASADSIAGSGYEASKAFDLSTYQYGFWKSGTATTAHWIQYDYGSGKAAIVTAVKITANYSSTFGSFDSYSFSGSDDQSTWTVLASGGYLDCYNSYPTLYLENHTPFRYYRLDLGGSGRSDNQCAINEITLTGAASISETYSAAITGLANLDNLASKYLWIKVEMANSIADKTPVLQSLAAVVLNLDTSQVQLVLSKIGRMKYPIESVSVDYAKASGNLKGLRGGQVDNFIQSFFPVNIDKVFNPNDVERISLTMTSAADLMRIYYAPCASDTEKLSVTMSATYQLIHVNDIPT